MTEAMLQQEIAKAYFRNIASVNLIGFSVSDFQESHIYVRVYRDELIVKPWNSSPEDEDTLVGQWRFDGNSGLFQKCRERLPASVEFFYTRDSTINPLVLKKRWHSDEIRMWLQVGDLQQHMKDAGFYSEYNHFISKIWKERMNTRNQL